MTDETNMTDTERAALDRALKAQPSEKAIERIQRTMMSLRKEGVPMIDIQVAMISGAGLLMASDLGPRVAAEFCENFATVLRKKGAI